MRFWVRPDQLAKLDITVTEILDAIKTQNTVNPAGQIGAEPVPPGQEFTYTVRAQGRLESEEEFGNIVVRANQDGSIVRLKDVARIELGAQMYNMIGRLNGKPAAIIAIYQLPGSNAIDTMDAAKKLMEEMKARFPADLDYVISLDTTLAVREGINEIVHTLFEALVLVIIVVFIFLQGWRATLIPLLAVPVSLVGTFALFPLLGFLDQHAVAVRPGAGHRPGRGRRHRRGRGGRAPHRARHVPEGRQPQGDGRSVGAGDRDRAHPGGGLRADGLHPRHHRTAVPAVRRDDCGIGGDLGVQRADAQPGALGSPAYGRRQPARGPLGLFFGWFNRWFGRATDGYVSICGHLIRKAGRSMLFLLVVAIVAGWLGSQLPSGFLPMEDQGYVYLNVQLPEASSLQRTDRGLQKDRGDPEDDAGRPICHARSSASAC